MYSKLFLLFCLALLLGIGCKSKQTSASTDWPFVLSDAAHNDLLNKAGTWLGVPYKYGGASRAGVDCSGLVLALSKSSSLPRSSKEMHKVCASISHKEVRTGDLIFFSIGGKQVNHVGMVLQTPWFIHASSSSGVVLNRWSEPYYTKWFTGFGRIPK
jgi:cell wall-associated NlpC family hydrolase